MGRAASSFPSTLHVERLGAVANHCELILRRAPSRDSGVEPLLPQCLEGIPSSRERHSMPAWSAQASRLPLRRVSGTCAQPSRPQRTHGTLRRPPTRYQQVSCAPLIAATFCQPPCPPRPAWEHSVGPPTCYQHTANPSLPLLGPTPRMQRPRFPIAPWVHAICAGLHAGPHRRANQLGGSMRVTMPASMPLNVPYGML